MRLIDADKSIKALGKSVGNNGKTTKIDIMDVKSLIKRQPVAYDVEKVVEQLKHEAKALYSLNSFAPVSAWLTEDVIELIKGGGVDE